MTQLASFISGRSVPSKGPVVAIRNPATGKHLVDAPMALAEEVNIAVTAAKVAQSTWSLLGLQQRINSLFDLRQALIGNADEITDLVVTQTGKTLSDAAAEIARSIEVIGHATAVTVLSATPYTRGVATDINTYEVRYPVGVIAAVSPFNFPILIPLLQTMTAIACGNTVVVKPSERNPSALLRLAELFSKSGLPDGVFNVLLGDGVAVDQLLEHPDIDAVTFVGSTPIARHVRTKGVAHHKRVQAFGGGKNHLVIMPDADLEFSANAAVSAAFGAAGQRCMAVSVVVAVGDIGDALVEAITERAAAIRIGDLTKPGAQLGPVISELSRDRMAEFVGKAAGEGGIVVLDGRERSTEGGGWYFGPTIIDHVKPGMAAHREEIFGPVLSIVRVANYAEAIAVIAASDFGNGAAIFTRDAATAARFTDDAQAGQIGINVPIPSPVYFHGFAGWRDSAFTETKMHGRDTMDFVTRTKTVTARTLEPLVQNAVRLDFQTR